MTKIESRPMKESGVGWIGLIPESWEIKPAKALFSNPSEPSVSDDVHLTPSQKYGVLPQTEYMEITGSRVVLNLAGADSMRHVEAGDYISHLRSFQGGLEYSTYSGKVSSAYTVLRPRVKINPGYFKHLFKSTMYVQGLQTTTDQLRDGQSIRYGQFALLGLPYPSVEEQAIIADLLDRETAQIDALIDKQQQLIETLAERRKAVITRAVTKGLDPNVPLKESGVEWLGEIPASWTLKRFKDANLFVKGGVWGNEPAGDLNDIWCVRMADFDRHKLTIATQKRTLRNVAQSERINRVLKSGDLVLEKSGGGDTAPVGTVVRFEHDEPAVCSNFACILRVRPDQDSKFWTYVHHAAYANKLTWRSIKQTSGIQNLDTDSYFNERIGFPPLNEQQIIVAYLDEITETIDFLIQKATSMVETLRERRQALISAAVTGKIDVRGK
jgi:type I restriction enzyme, S subunit